MPKRSAGLLLFRKTETGLEVLLGHPGGPFWKRRDDGAWSIPKGEIEGREEPLAAAIREFQEEMGVAAEGDFIPLEPVKQASGKLVFAWAVCSDFNVAAHKSNMFSIEWPPKSGKILEFAEVDRAAWFDMETARRKILPRQEAFLDSLLDKIHS